MPKYGVHFQHVVSTALDGIEAQTPDLAIEEALGSQQMPTSITHGAFGGGATVDDAGEWEAYLVTDTDGNEVWKRPSLPHAVAELLRAWPPASLDAANELVKRLEEVYLEAQDY